MKRRKNSASRDCWRPWIYPENHSSVSAVILRCLRIDSRILWLHWRHQRNQPRVNFSIPWEERMRNILQFSDSKRTDVRLRSPLYAPFVLHNNCSDFSFENLGNRYPRTDFFRQPYTTVFTIKLPIFLCIFQVDNSWVQLLISTYLFICSWTLFAKKT